MCSMLALSAMRISLYMPVPLRFATLLQLIYAGHQLLCMVVLLPADIFLGLPLLARGGFLAPMPVIQHEVLQAQVNKHLQ